MLGGELGFGASKDKGIGFNFKKEFNKGGRVAYQEGTDLVDFYTGGKYDTDDVVSKRQEYETPVTDVIKSVNEKTIDALEKGGELFNKFSGIDAVYDFPGAGSGATGASSDFRHQAASNALAKALSVSRQTINSIENGKFDPSLTLAIKLTRFFEVSLDEIFIYKD